MSYIEGQRGRLSSIGFRVLKVTENGFYRIRLDNGYESDIAQGELEANATAVPAEARPLTVEDWGG